MQQKTGASRGLFPCLLFTVNLDKPKAHKKAKASFQLTVRNESDVPL